MIVRGGERTFVISPMLSWVTFPIFLWYSPYLKLRYVVLGTTSRATNVTVIEM